MQIQKQQNVALSRLTVKQLYCFSVHRQLSLWVQNQLNKFVRLKDVKE